MPVQACQSKASPFLVDGYHKLSLKAAALQFAESQDTQPAANIRQRGLFPVWFFGGFLRGGEQLENHALKLANARFTDNSATLILSPNVYALYHRL